ncbi:sensor histidine kinase [Paenibacillus thalictri]|uniref:histidine kinase n=1 Tax=Paenibacillus thalictri TaxID=2527873 RepID=A0A4Q9DJ91_9BACL|nr:HAMP domain-containing sensor histidine kinase [Paenibacillus thalictri]TBL73981.1 HAMP domain-containing sensor histidine kinase [Paenibacillus thalictri]
MTAAIKRIKRFFFPESLRYQLLSRSLFIIAALLLLIGLFQYFLMHQFLFRSKAQTLQNQILAIPGEAWLFSSNMPRREGPGQGPGPGRGLFIPETQIAFIDPQFNLTEVSQPADSGSIPRLPEQTYSEALQQKKMIQQVVKDEAGQEQLVVLQSVGSRGKTVGVVQVGTPTKPLIDVLISQLLTFLLLAVLALVAGLLGFLPVLKRTLVPLSNIVSTVRQIDAGNLTERLPTKQGQTEIDRLSVSFNGMLERIESSFEAEKEAKEQMRRFIADASHELRTPLTSIHGFLEVLLRGAVHQPEQLHKALTSMYSESERINKLVQDLLLLARLDRTPTFEKTPGDLGDVVKEMETQLKLLAGERKVSFSIAEDAYCVFDPDKMKQVILNLFHNAVQHTDAAKGHIHISLDHWEGGIRLTVKDNGPGIAQEHLTYLFDRFYRIDTSRARKYGGAGLGLSITKSIVDLHEGTIEVESAEGAGCAFRVWLPELRAIE